MCGAFCGGDGGGTTALPAGDAVLESRSRRDVVDGADRRRKRANDSPLCGTDNIMLAFILSN